MPVNSRLSLTSALGVVRGHSAMPKRAKSLRWFQSFPPSPRNEEVRYFPYNRRDGMKSKRLQRPYFDLALDQNTGLSTPGDMRLPAYRQSGDENDGTFALGQCRPPTRH